MSYRMTIQTRPVGEIKGSQNSVDLSAVSHPAVKRDQSLPVSLGGRPVVAPAPGKGEAVVHFGVDLKLAGNAGLLEEAVQLLDHGQGRQVVMLGAGDVKLTLDLV